jgi:hypothetical protein
MEILLPKSEIFAIVFRWTGKGEIAAEEARRLQSARSKSRGKFLLESAITH